MRRFIAILLLTIVCATSAVAQQNPFPLPAIPASLTTPAERANYLALHFWDNFPADDTTLIGKRDVVELSFANFLSIMPVVTTHQAAFDNFLRRMECSDEMYDAMLDVAERYLFSPFSPMYDEELYIFVLQAVLQSDYLPDIEKEYFRYQLSTAMKNRVGKVATNLKLITADGRRQQLHKIESDYTILCLSDPQCGDCNDVKRAMHLSSLLNALIDEGRLTILYVCVSDNREEWMASSVPQKWINAFDDKGLIRTDQAYDTATIPALYLLDREHRVIKKNSTVRGIEAWLKESVAL